MSAWITRPKPNSAARLRLFCLPYAGGGASAFFPWATQVLPDVEVCPIQLPGRENRLSQAPFDGLMSLVERAAQELGPYLDRPFALFGHSMGALIGFELARCLRRRSAPQPAWLFVSGYHAPQLPYPRPPLRHLSSQALWQGLAQLGGGYASLPEQDELAQLMLPTVRADLALCETYVYAPEEALSCPISAFGGTADREVSRDQLWAWQVQTRSGFSLCMLPGDHFFLFSARQALLQALCRDLAVVLRSRRETL